MNRAVGGRGVGRRLAHLALAGLLGLGYAAAGMVVAPGVAVAEPGDGTVTVQVLRNFSGTGVINAVLDTPQRGIVVEISDLSGNQVRDVTDATGKVVLPPSEELTGGQYRVDVSVPESMADFLEAAPASTEANHFDSFTSFVDVRGGTDDSVITGVWNPNDYTLPDSRYFVPVQSPPVDAGNNPVPPGGRALVAFDRETRGTCPDAGVPCPEVLNTQEQVGTTWGLAYDKYRDRIFQSAFAKRLTNYGPQGGGAIYTTPVDGGEPELFASVPGAAVTGHGPGVDMRKDPNFVDVPGKESIGGIALTEDGETLYAVNLRSRELVSYDATGPSSPLLPRLPEDSVRIPDPGCADEDDWRPFAVTANDAKLYVGGVCSAESTQNRDDLKAVVYTYDGDEFTPVLTRTLTDLRGYVARGIPDQDTNRWNPWEVNLDRWDEYNKGGDDNANPTGPFIYPQPALASMAFTRNGSMILGFRDRFMDVVGSGGLDPRPDRNNAGTAMSGGDINFACATPDGGFEWEGTGNCPTHGNASNNGQQEGNVAEYFPSDFYDPEADGVANTHEETAQGSVAYIKQDQFVLSTDLDPARDVNSNGAAFYDVDTGIGPATGYQFVGPNDNGFAKAGGLGALAYQAANAPIQIGNIVWFDGDRNGVQDPYHEDEVPLAGATVSLLDADGEQLASTRTDNAGEYYFGGVGAEVELERGADYTVQFDVCTAATDNVPGQPPATDLRFTLPTAGDDRVHDSNVVPPTSGPLCSGSTPVTAPAEPGGVDHTIDAGVHIPGPTPPPDTEEPGVPGEPDPGDDPQGSATPGDDAAAGESGEDLAYTGLPGWKLIGLGLLALGTGVACLTAGRKLRTG